jgi:biotin carboxylase
MAIPSRSRCDVPFAIFSSTVDRFACEETWAEAVLPARGFRSERAAFAKALAAEGIVFIGPTPLAIEAMGDRIESKKFANASKVSTAPDFFGVIGSPQHAHEIGYPVMIKASAGGGGKRMRIAHFRQEVAEGFARAQSEALSSFGDVLLAERDATVKKIVVRERESLTFDAVIMAFACAGGFPMNLSPPAVRPIKRSA